MTPNGRRRQCRIVESFRRRRPFTDTYATTPGAKGSSSRLQEDVFTRAFKNIDSSIAFEDLTVVTGKDWANEHTLVP